MVLGNYVLGYSYDQFTVILCEQASVHIDRHTQGRE